MEVENLRTFQGIVDATISGPAFCIAGSNGKNTLVPDVTYLRRSIESSVEEETDTTGTIITREYEIIIPMDSVLTKKIVCYVKTGAWNTVAANPNDTYRVKASVLLNGNVIAEETGAAHSPNSTTEVIFNDIIVLDVNMMEVRRGDKLTIKFDVEVIGTDATNPGIHVKLYCDPSVDSDALIVYFE